VRTRLVALGAEPVGSSVEEFRTYLARQRDFTSALIREAGITAD
jgi:tripartite-type tricarboxylate transporter receptor subunit TctC